jgi:hypothetical protein
VFRLLKRSISNAEWNETDRTQDGRKMPDRKIKRNGPDVGNAASVVKIGGGDNRHSRVTKHPSRNPFWSNLQHIPLYQSCHLYTTLTAKKQIYNLKKIVLSTKKVFSRGNSGGWWGTNLFCF